MGKSTCNSKWLDTCEIWKHGLKLEHMNPGFCFLGVFSSDIFEFIYHNEGIYKVCGPDPLLKKKLDSDLCNQYGFVINTDPVNKPGKHWVSVFGESGKQVQLMDSAKGKLIQHNKDIANTVQFFSDKINCDKKNINYCITNKQKQPLCGWYSLFHLQEKINDKTCTDLFNLNDDKINYHRAFFEDTTQCKFSKPHALLA